MVFDFRWISLSFLAESSYVSIIQHGPYRCGLRIVMSLQNDLNDENKN